jgi:hypothetical protein
MNRSRTLSSAALAALALVACSTSDDTQAAGNTSTATSTTTATGTGGKGTGGGGTGGQNTGGQNTGGQNTGGQSTGGGGTGGQGAGGGVSEYGFAIRTPQTRAITCTGAEDQGPQDLPDTDYLCTFVHGGVSGYVYLQSTPVSCTMMMSALPTFETKLAQISIDGAVTDLSSATYEWGGNHHNDSFSFVYGGQTFTYDHSSFGFGFRCCDDPDCLRVSDGATVVEDGCTKERTLPIVCVLIKPDATHDPLDDTFEHCPGDPNYD